MKKRLLLSLFEGKVERDVHVIGDGLVFNGSKNGA
jgi:hypothetical protein